MLHKIDHSSRQVVLRDGKELLREDHFTIYEYCYCFYLVHANIGLFLGSPITKFIMLDEVIVYLNDN